LMRFLTKMSRRKRSRAVNRTPREVLVRRRRRGMANAVLAQPPIPSSSIQNHDALSARSLRLH
jgi:hypothetical protein